MLVLRFQRQFFARSRLRKQMQFAPERKNLALAPEVRDQVTGLRQEYQAQLSRPQLFTDVLGEPQPVKMGKVFKIDEKRLAKAVRKQAKTGISLENVHREDDDPYPEEKLIDKSHLYDQAAEIELEKEFKKQLFRKTETKRLISRKFNNPDNWLPQPKDEGFRRYLEVKNQLKNVRIAGMLNHTGVNRELELLIQSGLMDRPENLRRLIDELSSTTKERVEGKLPPSTTEVGATIEKKVETDLQKMPLVVQDEVVDTKDFDKLKEFMVMYHRTTEQGQKRTLSLLDLLNQVREFESKAFEQRYEAINYRYGGRVDYDHFTEPELLSYLKHEPMQPKNLLTIFQQNLGRLNRANNAPVITPTVAAQIYTKTCLYKFPETDTNSRINMLADRKFIQVERFTFQNCDKLSNQFFADALESFSRNHKDEQGAIRPRMFDAILNKICTEFEDRVGYIPDAELGAVCRSLVRLPVFEAERLQQAAILQSLGQRLPSVQNMYALESISLFVSMLAHPQKVGVLSTAVTLFANGKDQWDHRTIVTMARAFSALLLSNQTALETIVALRKLFNDNPEHVVKLIDNCNLNVKAYFTQQVQAVAGFLIRLSEPSLVIFNKIKRMLIDTIRKQLGSVSLATVPQLACELAYFDYWSKYKLNTSQIAQHSLVQSFFFINAVKFNSKKFLPYHEVAKFFLDERDNLTPGHVALAIRHMSLAGYKNESFYDAVAERILLAANSDPKCKRATIGLHFSFHLQKRYNTIAHAMYELIRQQWRTMGCRVEEWIELVVTLANQTSNVDAEANSLVVDVFTERIWPYRKHLCPEQLVSCLASLAMVLPVQQGNALLKPMVEQLCGFLPKEEKAMRLQLRLLLRISAECLQLSLGCPLALPETVKSLSQLESEYRAASADELKQRHEWIGSNIPYERVCEQFYEQVLKEQGRRESVVRAPWRIELPQKKQVHLLLTYDMVSTHRQSSADPSEPTLSVYATGLWKLLHTLFRLRGYHVKLLETYLWKNC